MRVGNLSGRLSLFTAAGAVDVEKASSGLFAADPQAIYEVWDEFTRWAATAEIDGNVQAVHFDPACLGAPAPAPAQVFGIGLNYRDHAAESNFAVPDTFPPTFTKFRTSLSGPVSTVVIPKGGHVDWEVELVVVIGRQAVSVSASDAWSYVAGLTAGQDISERVLQLSGPAPQFSLGKSYPGFAPIGPWVVTMDEFSDPDDIELHCTIDGETVQHGRTRDLIFTVPALVAGLSHITALLPGDIIFTGTPAGVGAGRKPPRFLEAGQQLVSTVDGIGELRQTFVDA